ncbi:MAG: DUF47 family protein [Verrucomicrobia bacterium]|nr:DUF47 family protein [Verrucomicrobiota bacterium]
MINLSRFLPREELFYDLLEASAGEAQASAELLGRLLINLNNDKKPSDLADFIAHRRKDKEITQQINEALCRSFVTPIDREDIVALSDALYKIPKNIERIGERLMAYGLRPWQNDFQRQSDVLSRATETMVFMVRSLRTLKNPDEIRAKNRLLQKLEGEGDELMLELFTNLFREVSDVKEILMRKDIYELLEKAIDRFRDAGNIVVQIVLKHT